MKKSITDVIMKSRCVSFAEDAGKVMITEDVHQLRAMRTQCRLNDMRLYRETKFAPEKDAVVIC